MASAVAEKSRDRGSFRDPTGYVFHRAGQVYRAIDPKSAESIAALVRSDVFRQLVHDGSVVETTIVDGALSLTLSKEHPGYACFLEHARIPTITYPYEWTISALADAGIRTLDLQMHLLEADYSLKDATAYNLQFQSGRPVFIDIASVEHPLRRDVWMALGQFHQMFTYPLLLARYHGWDLRSYFLSHLNGRSPEQVVASLGILQRWRPRYFLDVTLPALLRLRNSKHRAIRRDLPAKPDASSQPQLMNLRRLRRKLLRLAADYRHRGVWTEYTSARIYSDESTAAKKSLVRQYLEWIRPASVLDAGCNTGDFSYLAADCGSQVLAVDADHDAVDLLYRRTKVEPATITPLVIDLSAPSPALGFLNQERRGFLDRFQSDCVLALALVHHLRVSGNLSLAHIRDLLVGLSQRDVILEFVPATDPAFQRLTNFRRDDYGDYCLESLQDVLQIRFEIVRQDAISGSERTLLLLRKRELSEHRL